MRGHRHLRHLPWGFIMQVDNFVIWAHVPFKIAVHLQFNPNR
jgi:hypothetical protein